MIVATIETNGGATIDRYGRNVVSDRNPDLMTVARTVVMHDRLTGLVIGAIARRHVQDTLFEASNLETGSALQTGCRRLSPHNKRQRQNRPDK